jgi:predicted kinase
MEALIFTGLQASGKSSFYKKQFFDTHLRINLDMLKTRHREQLLLQTCLAMKQPFVVDNTNPTARERARYILPANAAGFRVVSYYFGESLNDCLRRNELRPGKARIPAKGILGTYRRLVLPQLSEGFDALFLVQLDETNGHFKVEEWDGNVRLERPF